MGLGLASNLEILLRVLECHLSWRIPGLQPITEREATTLCDLPGARAPNALDKCVCRNHSEECLTFSVGTVCCLEHHDIFALQHARVIHNSQASNQIKSTGRHMCCGKLYWAMYLRHRQSCRAHRAFSQRPHDVVEFMSCQNDSLGNASLSS